jgi:hypothetical protein
MVGGVFTPTEAAAVAAVYALFVTMGVYRSLDVRRLFGVLSETSVQFAQILFCVAGASIFGWILSYFQAPAAVTAFILAFTQDWRINHPVESLEAIRSRSTFTICASSVIDRHTNAALRSAVIDFIAYCERKNGATYSVLSLHSSMCMGL